MKPARTVFRKRYSDSLLAAIDWCMEDDPMLRPQSAAELRPALLAENPPRDEDEEPPSTFERLVGSLPWGKG